MTRYAWPNLGQQEGNIAGSRLADQLRAAGLSALSMTAARDAALAELLSSQEQLLNVRGFGAKGDGVTDDTAAIQAAIDAAHALAYGVVYIPAQDANNGYRFTQLKYHPGTRIRGDGHGGTFGGSRGTWLYQIAGTALEMVVPNDPAVAHDRVLIEHIGFSAFFNQAANTGGIRLEHSSHALLYDVAVSWTNVYGIQLKQGGTGGEMYNSFHKCTVHNQSAGASCFLITSNATQGPDATTIFDCHVSVASATFIKVDGTLGRGGGELAVTNSKFICSASSVAFHQEGTGAQFDGCRFEAIGGGSPTLTVTIAPTFGHTSPSGFLNCTWAAPGGLIWTDTTPGVRRSPRLADNGGAGPHNYVSFLQTHLDTLLNGAAANVTPNAEVERQVINVTTNGNFTINNPVARQTTAGGATISGGTTLIFDIKNSSGGAMGTITWGATYLLAGALTNPATGKRRIIAFYDDGTNMVELYRSAADI